MTLSGSEYTTSLAIHATYKNALFYVTTRPEHVTTTSIPYPMPDNGVYHLRHGRVTGLFTAIRLYVTGYKMPYFTTSQARLYLPGATSQSGIF